MCGSFSGPHKSSEYVETEKQCCLLYKSKQKAWDIECKNWKKELRQVQTTCKQLPTYHQIRKSLSPAQAKQNSANTESHQKMETELTYTQEILLTPSKATEQRLRPKIASRGNRGDKQIVDNQKHHSGVKP